MAVPNQATWRARVNKMHADGIISFPKVGVLAPPRIVGRPIPESVLKHGSAPTPPAYTPTPAAPPVTLPPLPAPPEAEAPLALPPQRKRTI